MIVPTEKPFMPPHELIYEDDVIDLDEFLNEDEELLNQSAKYLITEKVNLERYTINTAKNRGSGPAVGNALFLRHHFFSK